eukprot:g19860.t1
MQHGFVQERSYLTNLIEFFEEVMKMIDEGKAVDVVYVDFSKVFDKVPRISMGPLTFMIYVTDLEDNIAGLISKFVDDIKIGGVADSEQDRQRVQQDIDQLEAWSEKWQMEFNPKKCEVMQFGRSSTGGNHTVNDRSIRSIDMQRNLCVQVYRSLKVAAQVDKVVKKAYGILAFIRRGNEYKDRQVMLQLRPHLECRVQFWSPHYQKDVDVSERVQKMFTRMLPGMGDFSYEERLDRL